MTAGLPTNANALLTEIDARRKEAQQEGQHFTPTPEQPFRKGSDRPCILWQAWNQSVPPGGTLLYSIGIANPTSKKQDSLLAHVYTGSGPSLSHQQPPTDLVSTAVDERFPRLTSPRFAGMAVDAGVIAQLSFAIKVPLDIEPSNYVGNCVLFRAGWHDTLGHLDRSMFVFEVSPRLL